MKRSLLALAILTGVAAHATASDETVRGRAYASHREADNYAFETPGGWHGHPQHGLELGAHWDRTFAPNATPNLGMGYLGMGYGPWRMRPGPTPWPLSNLDIEVNPE